MRKLFKSSLLVATFVLGISAAALAAEFTISLTIGAQTTSRTINPSDARVVEFIDDLRNDTFNQIDDGAGGLRVMTRVEAGKFYVDALMDGQIEFARGLKQQRMNKAAGVADNLEGN